jgi:hypothetical protein
MRWSLLERWIRIAAILALCSTAGAIDSLSTSPQSHNATPVREADAICSKCHQDIFRKYLGTPMANASGLASDRIFTERVPARTVWNHVLSMEQAWSLSTKTSQVFSSSSRAADRFSSEELGRRGI